MPMFSPEAIRTIALVGHGAAGKTTLAEALLHASGTTDRQGSTGNGNSVGDTPLANLSLPAGEHQITFRHPQLGEQTQRVMVKSGALTRVSATLAR